MREVPEKSKRWGRIRYRECGELKAMEVRIKNRKKSSHEQDRRRVYAN